jgi:protoporphyrinogen oxidase
MDIGGHRFFSKSDRVMDWWLNILPLEHRDDKDTISYQGKSTQIQSKTNLSPDNVDKIMLVRKRKSRIYFLRKFFDYPITLSIQTISNLGILRTAKSGISYIWARLFPIKQERSLEDFFINRFGKILYLTFFKSYTEKVWGIECSQISSDWGKQRIKGLSITKAVLHALRKIIPNSDIRQKNTETSLIEKFMYPKYGPGQMWETVADKVTAGGGQIHFNYEVVSIDIDSSDKMEVVSITARNTKNGELQTFSGDYFFSTMPIKNLVNALKIKDSNKNSNIPVPTRIQQISDGLLYRDFITVGLLLDELKIKATHSEGSKLISDNWIYIQEPDVKVGRLQIFNNWSPYMLKDQSKVWLGLEYFCNEGDSLWLKSDDQMIDFAKTELDKIGIIDKAKVTDAVSVKVEKTYPAYFGTYDKFDELKKYLVGIENLHLIGRNGMHRYNNQDHSMLTAMISVDNILAGKQHLKELVWDVNTEQEYHEKK